MLQSRRNALVVLLLSTFSAGFVLNSAPATESKRPVVKVVQHGESSAKPDDCRGLLSARESINLTHFPAIAASSVGSHRFGYLPANG